MELPEGLVIGWDSTIATIPSGWNRNTSLDGRYLKGAPNGEDPGETGGNTTHNHSLGSHSHGLPSLEHQHTISTSLTQGSGNSRSPGEQVRSAGNHVHSGLASQSDAETPSATVQSASAATTNVASPEPARLEVIWIESDGSPTLFPEDSITFFGDSSLPTDWLLFANGQGRFLKGAATAANGGATAASSLSHTHTTPSHSHSISGSAHSHTVPATGTAPQTVSIGTIASSFTSATPDHVHNPTLLSTSLGTFGSTGSSVETEAGSVPEPLHRLLGIIKNDGAASIHTGQIVVWTKPRSQIPSGWAICDGAHDTPDMRGYFVKGAANTGEIGDTGGSEDSSHSHTNNNHAHSGASHNHNYTAGPPTETQTEPSNSGFDVTVAAATHTHQLNGSVDNVTFNVDGNAQSLSSNTHTPPFTEVIFIQKLAPEVHVSVGVGIKFSVSSEVSVSRVFPPSQHRLRFGVSSDLEGSAVTSFDTFPVLRLRREGAIKTLRLRMRP